jgi:hypothetical protein
MFFSSVCEQPVKNVMSGDDQILTSVVSRFSTPFRVFKIGEVINLLSFSKDTQPSCDQSQRKVPIIDKWRLSVVKSRGAEFLVIREYEMIPFESIDSERV